MSGNDNGGGYQAPRRSGPRPGLSAGAVTGIDLKELGSAEVIEIDVIQIDEAYQRSLRYDLINSIARKYDIVKAGAILVSERRDGSLWAVDGQHRMIGAQQAGESQIFAHVVHGLTQAQEADLRLARNDRRSDTLYEKFRTRLVMGDPKAHAMVELVRQQGTEINVAPTVYHGINGIGTIEVLYDIDGEGVWLGRVLRLIREAFGEDNMNPDTCSTSMMKAVCWFIAQHIDAKQVSWNEFVDRLGAAGVEDIRRKAASHRAINGGAQWVNYYRAMVEMWNYRRQENRKIQAKTIGSIAQLGATGTRTGYQREPSH